MADNNNRYSGKRLVRPRRGAILGGVAAGIADYLGIDPVIMRLIFVLLIFVTNLWGFALAYVLALIIIPEGSSSTSSSSPAEEQAAGQTQASGQSEEPILNMESESSEEGGTKYTYRVSGNNDKVLLWVGIFMAILGAYLLINNFFGHLIRPYLSIIRNATFSSLLILIGIYLIVRKK